MSSFSSWNVHFIWKNAYHVCFHVSISAATIYFRSLLPLIWILAENAWDPPSLSFFLCVVFDRNFSRTPPLGKAALRLKSRCQHDFQSLEQCGPSCVFLLGYPLDPAPSYPWYLTSSLICPACPCFCDCTWPVSSTLMIVLFLPCLVETIHPLRCSQMEWNLYILFLSTSNIVNTSDGWLIKRFS